MDFIAEPPPAKTARDNADSIASEGSPDWGLVALAYKDKASARNSFKERTIDIGDADKVFGWWQKKEYEKMGVEQIRLSANGASLDLKAPYQKNALVAKLQMDKEFSFQFDNKNNNWNLNQIKGLKVNGIKVERAQASKDGISFWNGQQKMEYGRAAADFIKALLDPLMRADLRK